MALAAFEALTAVVTLRCEAVERDAYGRLVAKCFSPSGIDIGRRLVAAGWALAYRRYSMDYVDAEDEARKARRGMWRGRFEKPWAWRASSAPQRLQVDRTGRS
jgi:endonuclease YncB( thermonuclease family)